VLRQAYDATWGRIFARGYDRFQQASEEAGMRDIRREVLSGASGRTLEIGSGSGLNHDLYPEAVTELVLSEPFGPMADQLRMKVAGRRLPVDVIQAPGEDLPFADGEFNTPGGRTGCTVRGTCSGTAAIAATPSRRSRRRRYSSSTPSAALSRGWCPWCAPWCEAARSPRPDGTLRAPDHGFP